MSKSGFEFDESAFDRLLEEEIMPKLQAQANATIQQAVREVLATHKGKPADEVRRALTEKFHGLDIEPEEPGFSETVKAISDGTMTD